MKQKKNSSESANDFSYTYYDNIQEEYKDTPGQTFLNFDDCRELIDQHHPYQPVVSDMCYAKQPDVDLHEDSERLKLALIRLHERVSGICIEDVSLAEKLIRIEDLKIVEQFISKLSE